MEDHKYRLMPIRDIGIPAAIYIACLAAGLALSYRFRSLEFVTNPELIATGAFTIAGVLGVMAGFVATATVFLAGASGPVVDRLRAELGSQLAIRMGSATLALLLGALCCAFAGVFSNGWGARGLVLGVVAISVGEIIFVALALTAAFSSAVRSVSRRSSH